MKRITITLLITLNAIAAASAGDLRQDFIEPPLKFATRPLWFWNNTTVTEEGIIKQMQEAHDKCGYGGFGILPFGNRFKPKYLTEEYFKVYGAALKKAKELGMTMCIYDEYGFPSGSAGAMHGDGTPRFAQKHPEHTIKRLDKHERDLSGPGNCSVEIPTEGRLMSIVAMEMATKKRVDLADMVKDGKVIWSVPQGQWKVMIFMCVKDGDPNVDYLDPEGVELFVEMTHQQYYNRFKEYFGNTIDGTFNDEPTMYRAKGRMWTGKFNEKFKAIHGFDPTPWYPALWYDIGPETQAARNYLFGFRSELYATGFPKVIQDWSTKHGIAATGHQDQEEVVNPVSVAGDLMKCFKHQDIPGVDKIGGNRPAERFYKIISSAAYNWDKALVMSETYGAMGDISWDTVYQVAMEQYTKGINQLIPHAVWYDNKKVTFKPELSWRHPKYADGLPQYNKYMSRLNLMLQNHGRHIADIAVLYPIATLQAGHYLDGKLGHYKGGVAIPEADYVDIGELLSTQVGRDYTFLHPEVLNKRCTVKGPLLMLKNPINHEAYRVMIMPGHKTISWSNLKKIKAFYDQGGKVIATGTLPFKSAEFGHDEDVAKTIKAMFPGVKKETGDGNTVTASSSWPGYGPELVSDSSAETRWNAKDGTSGDQWLEISFSKKKPFNRVEILEVFGRITSYNIQYLEGDKWVDCAGGTTLGHKVHTFKKVTASRVRLYIHSVRSASASIAEFAVVLDDDKSSQETDSPGLRNSRGGMAVFLKRPAANTLRETLDSMVDVYDVNFEVGKELRYIHKVKEGKDIYFFANLGRNPISTWVELRGTLSPETWNPHTGDIVKTQYSHEERRLTEVTKVKIELPPIKSLFIIARQGQ